MNSFAGFVLIGVGFALGVLTCGGMRAGNRQARNQPSRRPAQHRHRTAAVRIRAGEPSWEYGPIEFDDTVIIPAVRSTT